MLFSSIILRYYESMYINNASEGWIDQSEASMICTFGYSDYIMISILYTSILGFRELCTG